MSVQDARIAATLPSHPKTKKLLRELGAAGGWYLVRLFLWASTDRSSGDLSGFTDDDLELAIDWPGDTGRFIATLASVGFVDGAEGARRIHDWAEHNPWAAGAAERSEAARWAAYCKRYGANEAARKMPDYAARMRPACPEDAGRTPPAREADAPSPYPSPLPSKQQQQVSTATPSTDLLGIAPPADLKATRAQRLSQVTAEAIETFNASKLVKRNGGLLPNVSATVGREKREQQVSRCVRVASQICAEEYGSQTITRQFLVAYWNYCAEDEHKSGRAGGGKDHQHWKPSFEYLTRETTMLEIYDRVAAGGMA